MPEEVPEPAEVRILPAGVHIRWRDGHESLYPHRYLRLACPCAGCVDEMTGRRVLDPASVPPGVVAVEWLEVGRYALQFLWSDAHYTGIYPYRLLRSLCPCSSCQSQTRGGKADGEP